MIECCRCGMMKPVCDECYKMESRLCTNGYRWLEYGTRTKISGKILK